MVRNSNFCHCRNYLTGIRIHCGSKKPKTQTLSQILNPKAQKAPPKSSLKATAIKMGSFKIVGAQICSVQTFKVLQNVRARASFPGSPVKNLSKKEYKQLRNRMPIPGKWFLAFLESREFKRAGKMRLMNSCFCSGFMVIL